MTRGREQAVGAAEIEARVRERLAAGDKGGAAAVAIRGYGPEIFGLLLSIHRDENEADEAFSTFTEKLWASLDGFAGRSSMRTWAYVIARRASADVRRGAHRERRRARPLGTDDASAIAAKVRTETLTALRTETKSELRKVRESLPAEDQMLLVLRVDRDLSWNELALVFLDDATEASETDIKRESARLRKRFQLVKEDLRSRLAQRGLLDG